MTSATATAQTRDTGAFLLRLIAWCTVSLTTAFLIENWLMHWQDMPGARALLTGESGGTIAAIVYAIAIAAGIYAAIRPAHGGLRDDAERITKIVGFLARGAFWAMFLVGLVDLAISFLRVEGMLPGLVGEDLANQLGLTQWRGPYVHMPIAALGFVIAFFTRGATFVWFTLLVVIVQLVLVIGRFIFSYEQAFVSDLVRMWYAGMFLFASAYTLVEGGHVRVDVFYAAMGRRTRAFVNGVGAVVFGMSMMWVILILGTATSASPIIGPFIGYEQGQQAYGLMTKYWMAAYLGLFATMMMFQFSAMLLNAGADWRGELDLKATESE